MAKSNEVEVKYLVLDYMMKNKIKNATLFMSRLFTVRNFMKIVGNKTTEPTLRKYFEEWHEIGIVYLDKDKTPMRIIPGESLQNTYDMYKELMHLEIKSARRKYNDLNEVFD